MGKFKDILDIIATESKEKGSISPALAQQLVLEAHALGKVDNDLGIEHWITYEDRRYPTLALRSDNFGTVGYSLDVNSGDLERVCICFAHSASECCCGAWDYDYSDD